MAYVLVPVPTEYVLDVMRWVLFRTDDGGDDRIKQDEQRVAVLISEADDATRQLLQLVARATLKDEPLRLRDLADELGQEAGDVRLAIRALNQQVLEDGRPFMELRNETAVGVHGQTGTIAHVSMRPDLATIIRKARGITGGAVTRDGGLGGVRDGSRRCPRQCRSNRLNQEVTRARIRALRPCSSSM